MSLFAYVEHPHIRRRQESGPAKVADQAASTFNGRLALKVTAIAGTMITAYVFTIIALISLPSAIKSGDTTIIIAWLSSNFLQLVLLPILLVGQNLQAAASDKRAEDTYRDAEAVLHEAQQIQAHLAAQDAAIEAVAAKAGVQL